MKTKGYVRVSGRGQVEGDGFPRQVDAIEKFCAAHGLVLGRVFREEAVSGTVEGLARPAFAELLLSLESGDVICVERLDRLARDLMVSEILLKECRVRGVKVYSCDQGHLIDMASDSGDPTRTLVRQLLGSLAQWQKSELVLKLRKSRDRIRERTGRCEGFAKYGATESQARCLMLIGGMREDGTSYARIAKFLNESEFKSRWGHPWTPGAVFSVWKNKKKI